MQINRPIDLAIFNGNTASAKPAVIIEAKSPTNAAEMFSAEHPNVKSLQEPVYYFMLEYVHSGNHKIKWLAITNFDEWYFFDVKDFIRYFGNKSKPIYDQFLKFKANQMSGNKTSDFYNEIAKPAIDDFLASCDINVVHFNLAEMADLVRHDVKQNVIAQAHDRIGSAMKHASVSAALASHIIAGEAKQSNAACHPERSVSGVEGSKSTPPSLQIPLPRDSPRKAFCKRQQQPRPQLLCGTFAHHRSRRSKRRKGQQESHSTEDSRKSRQGKPPRKCNVLSIYLLHMSVFTEKKLYSIYKCKVK